MYSFLLLIWWITSALTPFLTREHAKRNERVIEDGDKCANFSSFGCKLLLVIPLTSAAFYSFQSQRNIVSEYSTAQKEEIINVIY